MEFRKNILLMLMQCIDNASAEDINTSEDMSNVLARLSNRRMSELNEIIQVIDPNNKDNVITYTYDKFIEIYDSYGLDGFVF